MAKGLFLKFLYTQLIFNSKHSIVNLITYKNDIIVREYACQLKYGEPGRQTEIINTF